MAERTILCEVHCDVRRDLQNLQDKQGARPCGNHEARLLEVEDQTAKQWLDIKDLQKTVWKGIGMLTMAGFFGSIIGSGVVQIVIQALKK